MGQEKAKYFATSDQSLYKRTLLGSDYELVDHVILNSNSYKQKAKKKQNIFTDDVFIKEKALQFAIELNFNEFQVSNLRRFKLFDKYILLLLIQISSSVNIDLLSNCRVLPFPKLKGFPVTTILKDLNSWL